MFISKKELKRLEERIEGLKMMVENLNERVGKAKEYVCWADYPLPATGLFERVDSLASHLNLEWEEKTTSGYVKVKKINK